MLIEWTETSNAKKKELYDARDMMFAAVKQKINKCTNNWILNNILRVYLVTLSVLNFIISACKEQGRISLLDVSVNVYKIFQNKNTV